MVSRLRILRALKLTLLGVVALGLLASGGDDLSLSPAQKAATPYLYDLVGWHAKNFLSKWVHRGLRSLPRTSQSEEQRRNDVDEYFRLAGDVNRVRSDLDLAAAKPAGNGTADLTTLEGELEALTSRRRDLRNDVEETLESVVSAVIVDDRLSTWGEFIFPPVDIRLAGTPKVFITSPRDRIERVHDVLLDSDIRVEERERIEEELLLESDLSALVLDLGGVATYPASLPDNQPLRWTLQVAAHEWLHHYFFFQPLGQRMFDTPEMQSLNETAANLAGREIGDRAFGLLGGVIDEGMSASAATTQPIDAVDAPPEFDFTTEMRATRQRVDALLGEGRVDEAETYMEERRRLFVENGHHIRKLNQAYFAFHGTYADSPSSVSPIGGQLEQFREFFGNVGGFISAVSGVSSYDRFLARLDELVAGSDNSE